MPSCGFFYLLTCLLNFKVIVGINNFYYYLEIYQLFEIILLYKFKCPQFFLVNVNHIYEGNIFLYYRKLTIHIMYFKMFLFINVF